MRLWLLSAWIAVVFVALVAGLVWFAATETYAFEVALGLVATGFLLAALTVFVHSILKR